MTGTGADISIGRLERVDLRSTWVGEASDFTPWLARPENITLLADAIGLDLEVEGQEQDVGPFRADILCKDTTSGHYVLIENQLERTDHLHLGQLMTYAAGLDAVTVVWIAARFTDEHRAALDWLNRVTNQTINFFGLEIELWRISGSPVAPKFNIVSRPNDWSETVASLAGRGGSAGLSETQQLHLDFWTQFRQFMDDRGGAVRINKPSKDHWTTIALGRSNFTLVVVNGMRGNFTRLYVNITGNQAKPYFRSLKAGYQQEVESILGAVDWDELPEGAESHVSTSFASVPSDRSTWPRLNALLAENIEKWVGVFRPIIKTLSLPPEQPAP